MGPFLCIAKNQTKYKVSRQIFLLVFLKTDFVILHNWWFCNAYRNTFCLHLFLFTITANSHYRIINSPIQHGVRSTLIIKQAIATDFGPYTCAIENNHGVSELRIELEQRSKSIFSKLTERSFYELNIPQKWQTFWDAFHLIKYLMAVARYVVDTLDSYLHNSLLPNTI